MVTMMTMMVMVMVMMVVTSKKSERPAIKYSCSPSHSLLILQSYQRRLVHSELSFINRKATTLKEMQTNKEYWFDNFCKKIINKNCNKYKKMFLPASLQPTLQFPIMLKKNANHQKYLFDRRFPKKDYLEKEKRKKDAAASFTAPPSLNILIGAWFVWFVFLNRHQKTAQEYRIQRNTKNEHLPTPLPPSPSLNLL